MSLSKRRDNYVESVVGGIFVFVVGVTFLQIILRPTIGVYLHWGEEMSRYSLLWMTLIGAIVVTARGTHLSVGIRIQSRLDKRLVNLIDMLVDVCLIVVLSVAAYQGARFVWLTLDYRASSLVWLRMGFVYLPLPISMAVLLGFSIRDLLRDLSRAILIWSPK